MNNTTAGPTLKLAILTVWDYASTLLRKWWLYLILIALFCALTFFYLSIQKPSYQASCSLMINNESSSTMSALQQFAGQFGLGRGGSGGGLDSEKVITLLASQTMVMDVLFREQELDGINDKLINHYMRLVKEHEYRFAAANFNEVSIKEAHLAKDIYQEIRRSLGAADRKKNGIISTSMRSKSEVFSFIFLQALVDKVINYYVDKASSQQRQALQYIELRKDSVKRALDNADYALKSWYDKNLSKIRARTTISPQKQLESQKLQRKVDFLGVAYEESIRNAEFAQMNLLMHTPVLQIIDPPKYPLDVHEKIPWIYYSFAIFMAVMLLSLFLIVRKLIKDALAS